MTTKKDLQDPKDRAKFLILQINQVCRSPWSKKDEKYGKVVEIKWQDREVASKVIPMYTEKGWIVSKEILLDKRGRTVVVKIKRPPLSFFQTS